MIKQKNSGIILIKNTANNVIITLTDLEGNTLSCVSAGTLHLKGGKKNTPYVIQTLIQNISKKIKEFNILNIKIIIKNIINDPENFIYIFKSFNFNIISIEEKISIAFNGCRLPKKRRL